LNPNVFFKASFWARLYELCKFKNIKQMLLTVPYFRNTHITKKCTKNFKNLADLGNNLINFCQTLKNSKKIQNTQTNMTIVT
jgi:hypothetical protein